MYALLLSAAALSGVLAAPVLDTRAADPRFTLYDLPTPLVGPCDLEVGHDNALWGQGILKNVIFRLDPATGDIIEYEIPFTTPANSATVQLPGVPQSVTDRTAFSCAIRKGDDGNLYAGNGDRNQLLRINETTGHIDVFTPPAQPAGNLFPFNDLYSAKDGIYSTATTQNTFSFFSFATEVRASIESVCA
jgi:streptogramin lyase